MSDPHTVNEVSVTIKVPESKKYAGDAPWIVFRGSVDGVREQLVDAFGLDLEGATLVDLTMQAQGVANTYSRNPEVGLGAKPIGKGVILKARFPSKEEAQGAAQEPATQAPAQEAEDPILAALKAATTLDEVKTIRAENQQAFNDNPDYLAAWKARGKAIKNGVSTNGWEGGA